MEKSSNEPELGIEGLDKSLAENFRLAISWGVFDATSYELAEEAKASGKHPFAHYLEIGEAAGVRPSPTFDPQYYVSRNPDVAAAGMSPLIHYLLFGRGEGRKATAGDVTDAEAKYQEWIAAYDTLTPELLKKLKAEYETLAYRPKVSVIMPTYNTPAEFLRRAIESVLNQTYPNWELCIADDASTMPDVTRILGEYAQRDQRIRLEVRSQNGHISEASNTALSLATGDFVAFLDHDDELRPHALSFVARAISEHPSAKLLYSDEDKIDEVGYRSQPHFKGDWNIDQLYSQNYVCHLLVIRRDVVSDIGGFRKGVEGSQDYDLILRSLLHVKSNEIVHIPRILYHWRAIPGSTALNIDDKSYAETAALKALSDHFDDLSEEVEVLQAPPARTVYRVRRAITEPAPHVDIIIPTRDRHSILETCVSTILDRSTYPDFTVWIVDNRSSEPDTLRYLSEVAKDPRVRILPCDMDFNYSAINNFAVRHTSGPVIALLNNDLEVITPDWLEEMVSHVMRPDVGCVGAKLYYPNDTVQHAGVIIGIGGVAGHSHKHRSRNDPGYFSRMFVVHEVSAVTAACLVVRKQIFDQVGGLDEKNLKVAFNDVDFCLRVREAGFRNVFTPHAELYHHESISRGYEDTPEKRERFGRETQYMKQRWGNTLNEDPFFNPNLSYASEDFALAWPPRVPT